MARLRIGFWMDPFHTVLVNHDTTFQLMLEAQRRGHEVFGIEPGQIFFRVDRAFARMKKVKVQRDQARAFEVLEDSVRPLSDLDALFLRKDPPVDAEYLHTTQLVELSGAPAPLLVNRPSGIRNANEKLFPLRFPELMPATVIDGDVRRLEEFIARCEHGAIVKPVDGYGGESVLFLGPSDRNTPSVLEMMTLRGKRQVVVQAFVPESTQGDKRVILLDGEPLGAVLRVARAEDLRNNLAAGGRAERTVLTDRDLEICRRLKPALIEEGLHFVGIDLLGSVLIEVNVTSPTGIAEIEALDGIDCCGPILKWVEDRRP